MYIIVEGFDGRVETLSISEDIDEEVGLGVGVPPLQFVCLHLEDVCGGAA